MAVKAVLRAIRSILCSWGFHKFTKWEHDPVAPVGFGSYRRHCLRPQCNYREAKD